MHRLLFWLFHTVWHQRNEFASCAWCPFAWYCYGDGDEQRWHDLWRGHPPKAVY